MGEVSKIQWTEATWNPWHGCTKVSPGCKFCYMYRDKERYGQDPTTVMKSKGKFNEPLKWKEGRLVFTCSWSDWFIKNADEWRDEAWAIIKATPQHTYQILTKRPKRIKDHLPADWGKGYDNVWLGVSIEGDDQKHRMALLADVPAKVRFISAEPLIAYLDLANDGVVDSVIFERDIHWLIIGGESGNETGKYRYRECKMEWIQELMEGAKQYDVPVFVKQLGTHLAKKLGLSERHGGNTGQWPMEMPKNYERTQRG